MSKLLKTLAAVATLGVSGYAVADVPTYNRLNFEVSATRSIANNEIHASLSKTLQAPTAKALATQLNPIMNAATRLKDKYPEVTLTTGNHYSYPTYGKNGAITGFTARASVELKSQNSEQISQFIADLQSHLTLDNLSFSVSDSEQQKVLSELKLQASQDFMNEAKALTKVWGASDYRLVNANLNGSGGHRYARVATPMLMMAESKAADAVAAPDFETGETELSYTISGTIELIK